MWIAIRTKNGSLGWVAKPKISWVYIASTFIVLFLSGLSQGYSSLFNRLLYLKISKRVFTATKWLAETVKWFNFYMVVDWVMLNDQRWRSTHLSTSNILAELDRIYLSQTCHSLLFKSNLAMIVEDRRNRWQKFSAVVAFYRFFQI